LLHTLDLPLGSACDMNDATCTNDVL